GLHGHQLRLQRQEGQHPDPVGPGSADAQAARLQVIPTRSAKSGGSTMALLRNVLRSLAVLLVVTLVTFCLMFRNGSGIARSVLGCPARRRAYKAKWARW